MRDYGGVEVLGLWGSRFRDFGVSWFWGGLRLRLDALGLADMWFGKHELLSGCKSIPTRDKNASELTP